MSYKKNLKSTTSATKLKLTNRQNKSEVIKPWQAYGEMGTFKHC